MTPGGQRAREITEWAWKDPAERVEQAIGQVRELARNATGRELAEIQDSGTMLSRLASSLDTG